MIEKFAVTIIEPSEIVAEGLSKIISATEIFFVDSIFKVKNYTDLPDIDSDVVIVNPLVVPAQVLPEFRHSLSTHTSVVALYYSIGYKDFFREYDAELSIFATQEQVEQCLTTVVNANKDELFIPTNEDLSQREKEILTQVAKGLTNKEIAANLNISIHTVISHRKNISHKLGINSISGLTIYAVINKLVEI